MEWRQFGMLPVVAALGYATSVIHVYGLGPYIEPIQEAFGWSRTRVTSGLTIATVINAVFASRSAWWWIVLGRVRWGRSASF